MYAKQSDNSFAHSALTLKLATANLYNFIEPPNAYYHSDQIYTQEQWQNKRSWLSFYLTSHKPDVIAFQEVFSPESLKSLVESQGYPYFTVVDKPQAINHYTFKKPVVCLASRYPILSSIALKADPQTVEYFGLLSNFSYSRSPIRATIELPSLGATDVYVVHLKSHRPMQDVAPSPIRLQDALSFEVIGSWSSTIQRGSEASHLMIDIINRRTESQNPIILMGDFNDDLYSDTLSALRLNNVRNVQNLISEIPLSYYQLHDSWQLFAKNKPNHKTRPATHYYQSKGSILDYILLSNEFDTDDINNKAQIIEFICEDRHLFDSDVMEGSDHALLSLTISLRE